MEDEILYGFPKREKVDAAWLQEQIISGASLADIVKLTGYSSHYIGKTIKELGLVPQKKKVTPASSPKTEPTEAATHKQQTPKKKAKAVPAIKEHKSININWLKQQLDSGTPIAEIARQAGYSRFGIYYNINKHDLNIPKLKKEGIDPDWLRGQKMLGKTDVQIAEEFDLNPSSVKYYRKKYGIDSFIIPIPKE